MLLASVLQFVKREAQRPSTSSAARLGVWGLAPMNRKEQRIR
jgi:hypothetical protein